MLSIIVGIQAQILTFALDFVIRLEDKRVALGRSGQLIARIEETPWLPAVVERYCEYIEMAETRFADTIVPNAVREQLSACEAKLHDLARGHLYVDSNDAGVKLELLQRPAGRLRTTSVQENDLPWHLSEVGRGYWRAQKDALSRGWSIERIFIYDEWTEEIEALGREQQLAGVRVKRVPRDGLPAALRADFTVWDRSHLFRQRVDETEIGYVDRFSVDPNEIDHYESIWRRLDATAETLA